MLVIGCEMVKFSNLACIATLLGAVAQQLQRTGCKYWRIISDRISRAIMLNLTPMLQRHLPAENFTRLGDPTQGRGFQKILPVHSDQT